MKVQKLITINIEIAEKLKGVNASELINSLLLDYFQIENKNLDKTLEILKEEKKKYVEIKEKEIEKIEKEISKENQEKLEIENNKEKEDNKEKEKKEKIKQNSKDLYNFDIKDHEIEEYLKGNYKNLRDFVENKQKIRKKL